MQHLSYLEFHASAKVVSDKDTQEFLDAAGEAGFSTSPPISLAIGTHPGPTPGGNVSKSLYLAPEPEALPLEEHLRQALHISHRSFRRCYSNGTYASSEYVFLALAKSHPELRDADRLEATERISEALGRPVWEVGAATSTVSRALGVDYMELDELINLYWEEIEPAILPPLPGETNLMNQAVHKMQDQPVVSCDCPDGGDRYHQLLSIAYWLSVFSGGMFGLEQVLLAKILGCSQRQVSNLIAKARKEGHLCLSPDSPQTPREAQRQHRTFEYQWMTELPGTVLSRRVLKKEGVSAGGRGSDDRGERKINLPSSSKSRSSLSDEEFLNKFARVKRRRGNEYRAECPAHADRAPSLDIKFIDGKRLLHCFAGCETRNILEAIGLTMADLFSER